MKLSHLNALRALDATLRHGSFSLAAQELGVTPAAVGQRVKTLEDYLGTSLFVRTPAGLRPRDNLQHLGHLLSSGFGTLSTAMAELKGLQTTARLSVSLPVSFVENWMTWRISEFYRRHSEVDLRLDAANRDVDLAAGDFDFVVRYGKEPEPQFGARHLFCDALLPVCAPAFADEYLSDPGMRSLQNVPLIHVEGRTSDPSWVGFDGWGQAHGFDPAHLDHGVHFSKVSSGLQAAIAGQGLALCGLVEAFHAIGTDALVVPFGPQMHCLTTGAYRLLWSKDRHMGQMQDDFRDWIIQAAAQFADEAEAFLGRSIAIGEEPRVN